MEKFEELNELIVRMFKKWIEVYHPDNRFFRFNGVDLTAEQILKQMEEKTVLALELKTAIKVRHLANTGAHSKVLTHDWREKNIFASIAETMKRLEICSIISR